MAVSVIGVSDRDLRQSAQRDLVQRVTRSVLCTFGSAYLVAEGNEQSAIIAIERYGAKSLKAPGVDGLYVSVLRNHRI